MPISMELLVQARSLFSQGDYLGTKNLLTGKVQPDDSEAATMLAFSIGQLPEPHIEAKYIRALYEQAARNGDPYSQQVYASILKSEGNATEGLKWLLEASKNGNAEASFHAYRYFRESDRKESLRYLEAASLQGNARARQQYAILQITGYYGLSKVASGIVLYIKNLPALIDYAKKNID